MGEELCERLMSLVVCKGMLDMLDVMCYCCAHEHGVLERAMKFVRHACARGDGCLGFYLGVFV